MSLQKTTLANKITIDWNPVTDGGQVRLDFHEFIVDDQGNPTSFTDPNNVEHHFDDIMALATRIANNGEATPDPVTGLTLPAQTSGAAIMFQIKRLVEGIIREKLEAKIRKTISHTITNNDLTATLSFSDSDYPIVDMIIDWDDETPPETVTTLSNDHIYANYGEYTIYVTVNTAELSGIEYTTTINLVEPEVEPDPTEEPEPTP